MIRKIKFKNKTVEIHIEDQVGKTTKETIFKSTEEPHPDFRRCFVELEATARRILDIGRATWHGQMSIDSVSFSLSDTTGVEGAVLTGHVSLETSDSPFNFNTPHLPFSQYSPTGESPLFPEDGVEILDRLRAEAESYMDGTKRAQLELAVELAGTR